MKEPLPVQQYLGWQFCLGNGFEHSHSVLLLLGFIPSPLLNWWWDTIKMGKHGGNANNQVTVECA
jgi:hypothetical protein